MRNLTRKVHMELVNNVLERYNTYYFQTVANKLLITIIITSNVYYFLKYCHLYINYITILLSVKNKQFKTVFNLFILYFPNF